MKLLITACVAAVALAGCSGGTDPSPGTRHTPSPPPVATGTPTISATAPDASRLVVAVGQRFVVTVPEHAPAQVVMTVDEPGVVKTVGHDGDTYTFQAARDGAAYIELSLGAGSGLTCGDVACSPGQIEIGAVAVAVVE